MPAAKKKTTTEKASVKRAPSKSASRTTVRRVARPKQPEVRSLRVSKSEEPFMTVRFTEQTFYWVILCAIVLALALWVLSISVKVQEVYDQVDRQNADTDSVVIPAKQ